MEQLNDHIIEVLQDYLVVELQELVKNGECSPEDANLVEARIHEWLRKAQM